MTRRRYSARARTTKDAQNRKDSARLAELRPIMAAKGWKLNGAGDWVPAK